MSQAPPYVRATDFSTDELLNVGGRSTVRTDKLDAELDALGATANALALNASLNQRDDGEIRDQRVKLFTLAPDVLKYISLLGGTVRGAWTTATIYLPKDVVTQGGNTYVAVILHTSGVFATDLAAVKWVLVQLGAATAASGVQFTPGATLSATNVQAAIDEADTENRAISAGISSTLTTFLINIVSSAGASLVGWIQAGVGAVLRTVQDKLRERISLFDFMTAAQIADVQARTRLLDVSAPVQAALTRANSLLGARLDAPAGDYRCDSSLNVFKRTTMVGEGRQVSAFVFTNAGDGFKSTWPINSSTAVWIGLRDLAIVNTNGANTGGGFVDVGGTFVDLTNVYIAGFRYQAIFDQTEIATLDKCELIHGSGKTGVWIVNGADHTVGASKGFTNRITISACQFNGAGGGLENILDDGGVNHTIRDNNFNDGTMALRAAGVSGISFTGNESETHNGTAAMVWTNTTKAGAYVGGCSAVDFTGGNTFYEVVGGVFPVLIDEIQGGVISGNSFATSGGQIMLLTNNQLNPTTGLVIEGNNKVVSGTARTAAIWLNAGSLVPYRNVQFKQAPATYVSAALASNGAQTITPQTMEGIHVGSRLVCQNQDGTNPETVVVTATTGATFSAVFVSTKNQANWCIYGASPIDEEEGTWTPALAGTATAGAHTAAGSTGKWSRRGNMVRLTGQIIITAKDAAMAGNLQINGNPFASNNIGNQIGTCAVVGFSGFTFPAGYTQVGGSVGVGASPVALVRSGSGVNITQMVAGDIPGTTCSIAFVIDMETSSN